jgi:metal-dependent amidase/aminoacylase/carboxypeptidase family protein
MIEQGVFEDIDIVLMAHPDVITAESGTSSAILPLSIKYKSKESFSYIHREGYSALDACLFTFTGLNHLTKGFPQDIAVDGIIANGGNTPSILPNESESRLYIRASSIENAKNVEGKIREFVSSVSSLMNMESEVSYYESPSEELHTNQTLSRIFCHNLKENGIIDCQVPRDTHSGLSMGNVSHAVPCIHPYINIVEDDNIKYASPEFCKATLTHYAFERVINTAEALAITGLDILSKEELLNEIRSEFYDNKKQ